MRLKPSKHQCDAELALSKRAQSKLKELLRGKIDRYRRTLAHLTVNTRDVNGVLVGIGATVKRRASGGLVWVVAKP